MNKLFYTKMKRGNSWTIWDVWCRQSHVSHWK